MRLLDRYLLRELLVPLAYGLCGFLVFWISSDLLTERLEEIQKAQLRILDVLEYYLVVTPEFLVIVIPIALLLALLYTLTNLARHHELVAMRAAGISFWRLSLPYFIMGLWLSLVVLVISEWWAPQSLDAAERILNRYQPATTQATRHWRYNLNFRNTRDDRIWSIEAYHLDTHELRKPIVDWSLGAGIRRQIIAERGFYSRDGWVFYNVVQFTYYPSQATDPIPSQTNRLVLREFTETPEQIRSEIKFAGLSRISAAKRPQLSVREILNYLRLHDQLLPGDHAMLYTQLHGRLAEPWTCLVVVLIALPFGGASARRNVFVGVANSLLICFAYFVLFRLSLALGTGGYLAPWLAGWLPNICFGCLGLFLTQRTR